MTGMELRISFLSSGHKLADICILPGLCEIKANDVLGCIDARRNVPKGAEKGQRLQVITSNTKHLDLKSLNLLFHPAQKGQRR